MSNTKTFMIALSIAAGIFSSSTPTFSQPVEDSKDTPGAKKEKCYGIVKASKNDCAAADGSHSCAGLAKNDGGGQDWVLLPSGTCDHIIGAAINPKS